MASTAQLSATFDKDVSIKVGDDQIGAASIAPSHRDVVLAGKRGLLILDLDKPYSPPRHIIHKSDWDVADVQWSPFASRAEWIASTANQKALIFNLDLLGHKDPVEFTLHAHDRAITDINWSAHHPDILATCAVDSCVLTWDLRQARSQAGTFMEPQLQRGRHSATLTPIHRVADFEAAATQVKWNRKNEYLLASSHYKCFHIWDVRKSAIPVTTIEAHQRPISGLDWSRSDAAKIITSSLDRTVKVWDRVGLSGDYPCVTNNINTEHPIKRARYTPFPNGILTMPRLGSAKLNLYTHSSGSSYAPAITPPVHTFQAHDDGAHVQEFLWRSRGSTDDGTDNREFQLISWGSDQQLHLYKVTPQVLDDTVGFSKGGPITEPPSTTRKGADYITFTDENPQTPYKSQRGSSIDQYAQKGTLSSLLQNTFLGEAMSNIFRSKATPQTEPRETMTAGTIRHNALGRVVNNIKWMEGVKVGERRVEVPSQDASSAASDDQYRWTIKDDLAAEVSHIGGKYTKVTFELVDVPGRMVTISFQGPWGDVDLSSERKDERRLVFLRMTITFPASYPNITEVLGSYGQPEEEHHPLQLEFHKTTAAIEDGVLTKLRDDMDRIASIRAAKGRDALDAVICYALGERSLEESLVIEVPNEESGQDQDTPGLEDVFEDESSEDESSSDDDDEQGLGTGNNVLNSSLTNANVPLPIQCTTTFSAVGALVLVRIPSLEKSHSLFTGPLRLPRPPPHPSNKNEIFQSFGRLNIPRGYDSDSPSSSVGSWDWSSSPSSSSSDNEAGVLLGRFQPPTAWQNPALRFNSKTSQPSSIGVPKVHKAKSVVAILASSVEEFVPSKRCLAEEYRIFGDGPEVCSHNADVARRFGFLDLADVWEFCKLILNNEVPLEILPQTHRREQVLVLARRALVRIKRKDSGLDLQFDEADNVTNPKLKGRIKWGHHPVVTWLIPALFDHFERLADTQMLAMLSCIFSEPAAREGVSSTMAKMRQSNLPMSFEAPAFSLDYFSSADAAWSLFKPAISIPSTPAHSRYAMPANEFGWNRSSKTLDTYGSHGSSNGPWGSDTVPSEPVTPHSTGTTPPTLSRAPTFRSTASHTPFSTSPEQSHITKKSPTANFASTAFASLSRPFASAISSSPPVKNRHEADLSTSAPTSGVTWGATTFYSSGSNERNLGALRTKAGKRASFGQADRLNIDYYSDSDSEYGENGFTQDGASEHTAPLYPGGEDEGGGIRVTLKNQDKFDDEACVSAPLLDMSKEWLYRAWRERYAELLGCWGLVSERAEVLKFNGMIPYFPPEDLGRVFEPGSMHLPLKKEAGENILPASARLSRASTLAPPPIPRLRRSPTASPRHFSFNPEAAEFRPGASIGNDVPLPPPDVFISSEQYLQLSIPAPSKEKDEGTLFNDGAESKLLKPRPGLSRIISKNSSIAGKKDTNEPVYSCSICWIRVSGRFFLCPSCGHVAHFDCMRDDEADDLWEEGECVVGCGCGCGFEEEEEKGIDYFRSRWSERGGWLPEESNNEEVDDEPYGYQGGYGDGVGTWHSPEKRSPEKDRGKGKRRM